MIVGELEVKLRGKDDLCQRLRQHIQRVECLCHQGLCYKCGVDSPSAKAEHVDSYSGFDSPVSMSDELD
jgi:hypothetical protein